MELPASPIIGRDREIKRLLSTQGNAWRGTPGLIAISASQGLGKSRLLQLLAEKGRSLKGIVLHAGSAAVQGTPYQALRPLWPALRDRARWWASHSNMPNPELLIRVVDGLLGDVPAAPPPPEVIRSGGPLEESLIRLVRDVAALQPTVLIIDDFHLADADTVTFVEQLAVTLSGAATTDRQERLLVAISLNEEEIPARNAAPVSRLLGMKFVTKIRLQPLDDRAMAGLLRHVTAGQMDKEAQARILREARGVPFVALKLLEEVSGIDEDELATVIEVDAPEAPSGRRSKRHRLKEQALPQLPPAPPAAADVVPEPTPTSPVVEQSLVLSAPPEPAALAVPQSAAAAAEPAPVIAAPSGGSLGEPVTASLIVDAIAMMGGRAEPEALTRLLQTDELFIRKALDVPGWRETVQEFSTGAEGGRFFRIVPKARSREVLDAMNPDRRRKLHLRAIDLIESNQLPVSGLRAATLAYHYRWAGLIERAMEMALQAGRDGRTEGMSDRGANHLSRGLALWSELPADRQQATRPLAYEFHRELVRIAVDNQPAEEAEQTIRRALDWLTEADPTGWAAEMIMAQARLHLKQGSFLKAEQAALNALNLYHAQKELAGIIQTLSFLGRIFFNSGDHEQARKYYLAAATAAKATPDKDLHGQVLTDLGLVHHALGDYAGALQRFDAAMELLAGRIESPILPVTLNARGATLAQLGKLDDGVRAFDELLDLFKNTGASTSQDAIVRGNLALLLLWRGETSRALILADQARAIEVSLGRRSELSTGLRRLATILREMGQIGDARRHLEDSIKLEQEADTPFGLALSELELGIVHRMCGEYLRSLELLKNAESVLINRGSPHHHAECLYAMAQTYLVLQKLSDAGDAVGRALTLKQQLEAPLSAALSGLAGFINRISGDPAGMMHLEAACNTLFEMGHMHYATDILLLTGLAQARFGDQQEALQRCESCQDLAARHQYGFREVAACWAVDLLSRVVGIRTVPLKRVGLHCQDCDAKQFGDFKWRFLLLQSSLMAKRGHNDQAAQLQRSASEFLLKNNPGLDSATVDAMLRAISIEYYRRG